MVDYGDLYYRSRLQALQGVDELVDSLVTRLEESDQLDNTYIIYTSDNGFHIGQHRLPPGKTCGFEEDIRVPLFIRGPGVREGYVQNSVTTHIDLAPTLFHLAGIPQRSDFDGTAIPVTPDFTGPRHEHVTVEFWGRAVLEGDFSRLGRLASSFVLLRKESANLEYTQLTILYTCSTTHISQSDYWDQGITCITLSGAIMSMSYMTYR